MQILTPFNVFNDGLPMTKNEEKMVAKKWADAAAAEVGV